MHNIFTIISLQNLNNKQVKKIFLQPNSLHLCFDYLFFTILVIACVLLNLVFSLIKCIGLAGYGILKSHLKKIQINFYFRILLRKQHFPYLIKLTIYDKDTLLLLELTIYAAFIMDQSINKNMPNSFEKKIIKCIYP